MSCNITPHTTSCISVQYSSNLLRRGAVNTCLCCRALPRQPLVRIQALVLTVFFDGHSIYSDFRSLPKSYHAPTALPVLVMADPVRTRLQLSAVPVQRMKYARISRFVFTCLLQHVSAYQPDSQDQHKASSSASTCAAQSTLCLHFLADHQGTENMSRYVIGLRQRMMDHDGVWGTITDQLFYK